MRYLGGAAGYVPRPEDLKASEQRGRDLRASMQTVIDQAREDAKRREELINGIKDDAMRESARRHRFVIG